MFGACVLGLLMAGQESHFSLLAPIFPIVPAFRGGRGTIHAVIAESCSCVATFEGPRLKFQSSWARAIMAIGVAGQNAILPP